uniref:Uncharacterized protein n=1 Tax=Magallana gigas TaxID=29159 RepID=K1Q2B7_MAGGI
MELSIPECEEEGLFYCDCTKYTGIPRCHSDLGTWLQESPTGEITTRANLLLYGDRESEDSELTQIHLYKVI